jgi:hypothetical protein
MFISCKYHCHSGDKYGKDIWTYELMDSEFGMVSGEAVLKDSMASIVGIGIAIIQEYNKRNLNVAANLMRAFVWWNKQDPYWTIEKLIDYNKKDNSLFPQYEKDLQKYLALL